MGRSQGNKGNFRKVRKPRPSRDHAPVFLYFRLLLVKPTTLSNNHESLTGIKTPRASVRAEFVVVENGQARDQFLLLCL